MDERITDFENIIYGVPREPVYDAQVHILRQDKEHTTLCGRRTFMWRFADPEPREVKERREDQNYATCQHCYRIYDKIWKKTTHPETQETPLQSTTFTVRKVT
jgi:hypothetical protein